MPKIIVQAISAAGEPRRWTLTERVLTANLDSEHYAAHLIQRLAWATADAEALESQESADTAGGTPPRVSRARTRGDTPAGRSRPRTRAGARAKSQRD